MCRTCLGVTTGAKCGWKVLRRSVMVVPCFIGGTSSSTIENVRNQSLGRTILQSVVFYLGYCVTLSKDNQSMSAIPFAWSMKRCAFSAFSFRVLKSGMSSSSLSSSNSSSDVIFNFSGWSTEAVNMTNVEPSLKGFFKAKTKRACKGLHWLVCWPDISLKWHLLSNLWPISHYTDLNITPKMVSWPIISKQTIHNGWTPITKAQTILKFWDQWWKYSGGYTARSCDKDIYWTYTQTQFLTVKKKKSKNIVPK